MCEARCDHSTRRSGWSATCREEIKPGDTAYLWLSGRRGGIIGVAEVLETPRVQPEPREQIAFIRKTEKFAGDQLRVCEAAGKRMP